MTSRNRKVLPLTAHSALAILAFLPAAIPTGAAPLPRASTEVKPCDHEGYVETVRGTKVRFTLVPIPGGTFSMGSPAWEKGRREDEGPVRRVTIRAFWMGRCEVTWDEYDVYVKQEDLPPPKRAPSPDPDKVDAITRPSQPYTDETFGFGRDSYPAIGVTHHAAMEYCHWLSVRTGKKYRLPTEAEWEWAARAGKNTAYFFGDGPDKLVEYAWYADNAGETTHPVAKKKPNPWGLYDIYGNATEWCLDHYRADRYTGFPADRPALSPVLLPTAARYPHVVRGGCWDDPAAVCRSAARRASDRKWQKSDPARPLGLWWACDADFAGFRVVRAVEEQEELRGLRSRVTRESK